MICYTLVCMNFRAELDSGLKATLKATLEASPEVSLEATLEATLELTHNQIQCHTIPHCFYKELLHNC